VSNPPWLAALDALCSKGGGLGGLVALHCLVHGLPYLPPPFDALHSSFFEGVLEGQTRKLPQHVLALDAIKEHLPAALGALYVARHVPAGFRAQATQFVRRIRDAAAVAVARSQWLSGAARAEAGRKLAAMRLSVGYADLRPEGAGARALRPDTFLENIYTLHSEKVDRLLGRLEHGMPGDSWDDAPFLVNAYYYTNTNEIVIPVANFSEPFFRAGGAGGTGAWNYGGLGAAIAHEITHAFDTDGQQLNSRGRKRQWWSARNQRGLRHRQGRLMAIYDAEGINGKATLDENLADLGGLEIALAAAKAAGVLETPAAVREFFTAYAVSWRTKEQGAKKRQRLLADKHAPVEARVNLIVSQFDEWYEAFGVGPSCRLYREPRTRLHLFAGKCLALDVRE
jgi:predicted metalloendopeptidase